MRLRFLIAAAAACLAASAGSAQQTTPRPRTMDLVPPEWLQPPVAWKDTWEQTLAATKPEEWKAGLANNPATAPYADTIVALRKAEMLKAMVQRFPGERARHPKAYLDIAQAYQQAGLVYWRNWWCWKLVADFPQEKDLVAQACSTIPAWQTYWGSSWHCQEGREWDFLYEDLWRKIEAGQMPADHPAVAAVCTWIGNRIQAELRYDQLHPFLRTLERLAKENPQAAAPADTLFQYFGHSRFAPAGVRAEGRAAADLLGDTMVQGFPRDEALETRWDTITRSGSVSVSHSSVKASDIQTLLDMISRTDSHQRHGGRYMPLWSVLDEQLAALRGPKRDELRALQQKGAATLADAIRLSGSTSEVMRAFRRYPLADCIHELMLDLAEGNLREGRSNWAIPVFRDVARRAANPALRLQAHAGLWLALAQHGQSHRAMAAAMAPVDPNRLLVLAGRPVFAAQLMAQLLNQSAAGPDPDKPVTLAALPRRRIALPPDWPAQQRTREGPQLDRGLHSPWPAAQVELAGPAAIVSSPLRVARFDGGGTGVSPAPRWSFAPPERFDPDLWDESHAQQLAAIREAPLPRRPIRAVGSASAAQTLPPVTYHLMGTRVPPVVAAVETGSGRVLWTSEGHPDWTPLTPLSRPAAAEGQVYLLATSADYATNHKLTPQRGPWEAVPQYLVCADADDGRILWKQSLGWQANAGGLHTVFDYARGAAPVTIHEGAVYCSTNLGVVARCDAHDGMVEWAQAYQAAHHQGHTPISLCYAREGAGPVMVGDDRILIAPRDHSGMLLLRRGTGEVVWESPIVPSDRIVGVTAALAVGINSKFLGAVDLASGRQLWCAPLPAETGSQAVLVAGDIILVSGGQALRLAAATGQVLERRDLASDPSAEPVVMPGGEIVELIPPPLTGTPAAGPPPPPLSPDNPMPREFWTLPCEAPVVAFQGDAKTATESMLVLTGRRLAMVRTQPAWQVVWQRMLPARPQTIGLAGGNALYGSGWDLVALDAATGQDRWRTPLPFLPAVLGGDAGTIYATAWLGHGGLASAGCLDPQGKLLWARCLTSEVRVGGGPQAAWFRREADGTGAACMVLNSDGAMAEVPLDAVTGKFRPFKPFTPPGTWLWTGVSNEPGGLGWIGSDHRMHAVRRADGTDLMGKDADKIDVQNLRWQFGWLGVHLRDGGVYARLAGQLLHLDPASGRRVVYDIRRPGEKTIQPFLLEFRALGDKMLVLSGTTGQEETPPGRNSPLRTPADRWKVYADLFDRAGGRPLARRELPGIRHCISRIAYETMAGLDSQVRFVGEYLVITDTNGLHVLSGGK